MGVNSPQLPTDGPGASRQSFDDALADMRTTFGASRVALIEVAGAKGVDLGATMNHAVDAVALAFRPGRWRVTTSGDVGRIAIAPVDSLASLTALLAFGNLEVVDEGEKLLHITLEHNKCVLKK